MQNESKMVTFILKSFPYMKAVSFIVFIVICRSRSGSTLFGSHYSSSCKEERRKKSKEEFKTKRNNLKSI